MLGSFAVGKTSLVSRFVRGIFSPKYLTTIGVKIDRKEVDTVAGSMLLLLWDLSGDDEYQQIRPSYLRGCAGYFLVVDGTRTVTLERAAALRDRIEAEVGILPYVLLLNKIDLMESWEVTEEMLAPFRETNTTLLRTSAKTGEGVAEAFQALANQMASPSG